MRSNDENVRQGGEDDYYNPNIHEAGKLHPVLT
jgi:hypothetical protein